MDFDKGFEDIEATVEEEEYIDPKEEIRKEYRKELRPKLIKSAIVVGMAGGVVGAFFGHMTASRKFKRRGGDE